jgi:hypothetical protein
VIFRVRGAIMYDVLHQLIDRVRWAVEEEQILAHQAVEDFRAQFGPQEPAPSTVEPETPVLTAVDSADTKGSHSK